MEKLPQTDPEQQAELKLNDPRRTVDPTQKIEGEHLIEEKTVYGKEKDFRTESENEFRLHNPDFEKYKVWKEEAEQKNSERSFLERIFKKKVTYADIAHEDFTKQRAYFNELKAEDARFTERLSRELYDRLESILDSGLSDVLKTEHVDAIISEDASGRIPSLILFNALNKVYSTKHSEQAEFISAPIGRGMSGVTTEQFIESTDLIQNLSQKLSGKKTCLYLTDYVSSGSTFQIALASIVKAADSLPPDQRPEHFIIISTGEFTKDTIEFILSIQNTGAYKFSVYKHKNTRDNELPLKRFRGIRRDHQSGGLVKDDEIEFGERKAQREEVIESVSEKLYEKLRANL